VPLGVEGGTVQLLIEQRVRLGGVEPVDALAVDHLGSL
jgi:hypothetical protein